MFNVRYHIASLMAVFLALALGLILGGLVVQRGAMDNQQASLVDGLRKEFSTLRTENGDLTAENERLKVFSGTMTGEWLEGRLNGRTILVIAGSPREKAIDVVSKPITAAGAKVAVVVLLKPDFGVDDDVMKSSESSGTDAERMRASVVASLVAEWSDARSDRALTASLVKAGVLRIDGLRPGVGAGGLVNVASQNGKADTSALALASAFAKYGVSCGAQMPTARTGVAAAADAEGLSAIDTLDTPIGDYSLVAILTGAKAGYYGVSDQAIALYPEVAE